MAGCFDSPWRVGSKARGTRSPFKLPTEGLLPFKCTYPVQLAGTMMGSLAPAIQAESPVRETRTPTVREYEETIEQLKKENFDLKLRRFLLEEHIQKYMQNNNEDQPVQVVVELAFRVDAIQKELTEKEKLLQEVLGQNEKYAADIEKLQEQLQMANAELVQLQEQLQQSNEEIPLKKVYVQLKDEKERFENEAARLRDVLNEKDQLIQEANKHINDLEAKAHKKSQAIRGIALKYHKDQEMIPKELRPYLEEAVQAAKSCKPEEMNAALGELKASLCKIMLPTPVREVSSAHSGNENTDPSKTKTSVSVFKTQPEASQSARKVNQSTDSKTKFVQVSKGQSPTKVKTLSQSSESINDEDAEKIMNVLKENEDLKNDNEEKARTIQDLNSTCGELERINIQLRSELTEAVSKVKKLEMNIREEKSKSASSLPKKSSSVQTAVQIPSLSDSFLKSVEQSTSVNELKEEILRLLLVIDQKDKELSDTEQELGALQSQLEGMDPQENETISNQDKDIDESVEINDLHQRLALSCQVNHDLIGHLRKLEAFMEDLLQHRNLDSSSLENISETSDVFSRLTNCLDETKQLSIALSDHLSVCENSKLFDSSDIRACNLSGRPSYRQDESRLSETSNAHYTRQGQGRNDFFPSESTARTGRRRLSFSTLHNANRLDSEKVVVLGTSNNEDLILLLNEKGDPEDVLIRSSNPSESTHLPKQYLDSSLGFNNPSELTPKRYLDPSMGFNNPSELAPKRYLDDPSMGFWRSPSSEMALIPKNRCPSSDSDIWSEPDRDVSMQRIGIDVQLSPCSAQKSPRRLRLRDSKRTTDELSSHKNESSSGVGKFHPLSKRRKSGETLRSAEREQLQKVVSDLSNKCSKQENELEEMREVLDNTRKENNALTEQKRQLSTFINTLEKELKIKTTELALQCSESSGNLSECSNENVRLKRSIELLETKASDSDSVIKKLKKELEETKQRLQNLDLKCSNYELELTSSSKTLKDYNDLYSSAVNEKDKLLKKIQELVSKRDELIESIRLENNKVQEFEKENGELAGKLQEKSESLVSLQSQYTELQNRSNELLRETQSKFLSSSSTCDQLREQLKSHESLVNEKKELFDEIRKLGSTKNELLQSIHLEKDKAQKLEKENDELKKDLQEKAQSLASLQSQFEEHKNASSKLLQEKESKLLSSSFACNQLKEQLKSHESMVNEKNELFNKIQKLNSSKNELVQSIQLEKDKTQKLENEKDELKEELQEKSQSLASLQSQFEEHKKTSSKLLREKETKLFSSNSTCNQLKEQLMSHESLVNEKNELFNKIQKLDSTKNELLQSIESEKNKIQGLENENSDLKTKLKERSQSLASLQSQFEELKKTSSKSLREKESQLFASSSTSKELKEQLKSHESLVNENNELFNNIQKLESNKNELVVSFELEINKRQELEYKNSELKRRLQEKSYSLASLQSQFEELEKTSSGLVREKESKLLFSSSTCNELREQLKGMQEQMEFLKETVCSREKSLEESKVKQSSLETELNSLQQKVKKSQKLLDSKDDLISEYEKMVAACQICSGLSVAGSASSLDPSNGSLNVSSASESSVSDVRASKKSLKSLKAKLVVTEKRIEILEKEKSDLRTLLGQTQRSRDEVDNLRKDLDIAKEQLEAKVSFIKDLKKEMFKNCNSLVDKQKEVDEMRSQLVDSRKQCTQLKLNGREERPKFRFSDHLQHSEAEANINALKRHKWELIKRILDQQKQFYECKNIHLQHFEKFKTHIEDLHANQDSPTMFRSDSEPFLNSSMTENNRYEEKCDKTLKNLQPQLELDIECLQNLNIFFRRFFIPLVLQTCEHCAKNIDSSPKHPSKDFEKSASSPAKMLHDNTSDRESLSEEIIHLSRSGSVSPMSFEGNGLFQAYKNPPESTEKNGTSAKENYSPGLPQKLSNVARSQESIFNRSHFSSPDLGIESDPNRESSAPEQAEKGVAVGRRHESGSRRNVPESAAQTSPTKLQDRAPFISGGDTLHAMGSVHNYELLKKEVEESLVGIKSVLTRTKDGLQRTSKFTSPAKNLEYATFKAIKDTSGNIEVCLIAARDLVDKFWIAPCPSTEELNNWIQISQEQQEKIREMTEAKFKEEKIFDDAMAELKRTQNAKDKMEKKISKKLVSTKKFLRAAEVKLLEQGRSQIPLYPRDEPTSQKPL